MWINAVEINVTVNVDIFYQLSLLGPPPACLYLGAFPTKSQKLW